MSPISKSDNVVHLRYPSWGVGLVCYLRTEVKEPYACVIWSGTVRGHRIKFTPLRLLLTVNEGDGW